MTRVLPPQKPVAPGERAHKPKPLGPSLSGAVGSGPHLALWSLWLANDDFEGDPDLVWWSVLISPGLFAIFLIAFLASFVPLRARAIPLIVAFLPAFYLSLAVVVNGAFLGIIIGLAFMVAAVLLLLGAATSLFAGFLTD